MEWHMHEMGTGVWIYLFLLILIIAVAAIFVVRRTLDRAEDEIPLDILKKRYAQGDISKEEFEQMRKEISEEGP